MATFDGNDLKRWREAQGMSAADLAERISVDVSTLYRYENGKIKPDPDVMYQICYEMGDVRKWQIWMATEFPKSYGRMHPEPLLHTLEGSILALYAEIQDLAELQQRVRKDGADGKIDSFSLREQFLKEVTDMIQAAQTAKALLEGDGGA